MKKLNGDVVEGGARFVAGDVGEAAAGEAAAGIVHLTVRQHETEFRFVLDGVDDVGGTEGYVCVGHIVLMEKSGFVSGDAHAENADIGIFKDEMVVGFLGDGDGDRRLGVQGKCEKQQR
jgi:hypothetical protein